MGNIVELKHGSMSPEDVLKDALEQDLDGVMVLGLKDGDGYFGHSPLSVADMVLLL